jgi:hypothetical protein
MPFLCKYRRCPSKAGTGKFVFAERWSRAPGRLEQAYQTNSDAKEIEAGPIPVKNERPIDYPPKAENPAREEERRVSDTDQQLGGGGVAGPIQGTLGGGVRPSMIEIYTDRAWRTAIFSQRSIASYA